MFSRVDIPPGTCDGQVFQFQLNPDNYRLCRAGQEEFFYVYVKVWQCIYKLSLFNLKLT